MANSSFYLRPDVGIAFLKAIMDAALYVTSFKIEGKLDALFHHLVACLAIPLVAVGPLLLSLFIAVDKGDGYDIVAWLQ